MTFEQCYTTTITAKCYKCSWCRLFGDGPCPFRGIHDNWPLGYESPPPSQLFIRREMSRFICTKDELKSMNPLAWLSCLFYIAKLRIACRREVDVMTSNGKELLERGNMFFATRQFHQHSKNK